MAAPTKRPCDSEPHDVNEGYGDVEKEPASKVSRSACDRFLAWCDDQGIIIDSKVTVRHQGSCAQCGMIAIADISKGETLFTIPRSVLLQPETCSPLLAQHLDPGSSELKSDSGWVPLILAVMYEYTNPDSRWRPYLDLFPDHDELDPPMFWDSDFIEKELKGTGIPEAVEKDLKNIAQEYNDVALPFIKKHTDLFSTEVHNIDLYKKLVSFVMAYSFTEPQDRRDDDDDNASDGGTTLVSQSSAPMMVPLADALNHIAKNNAHLKFGKDNLSMVATRDIRKGSEVFNTYGELANWELLHMYGFSEVYPANIFDTVDIPNQVVYDEAKRLQREDTALLDEKWKFLKALDIVADNGRFVINIDGVLTEEELYTTLKVLAMGGEAFADFQENDGWCSDDETDESLSNEDLPNLPASWRRLLSAAASRCLREFSTTPEEDDQSSQSEQLSQLSPRSRYALYVRVGQRKLLERSCGFCTTEKS